MAKAKAPWTVVDGSSNQAKCLRCGAAEPLPTPMMVSGLVQWIEAFVEKHAGCTTDLWADTWYNRSIRLWTIQIKDGAGNQIGEAEYEPSSPGNKLAKGTAERMLREALERRLQELAEESHGLKEGVPVPGDHSECGPDCCITGDRCDGLHILEDQ